MPDSERSEIEIETPCPRSWESLVGDERRRFCSECQLHVHNSATLTRNEVLDLVRGADERVCMRIVRGADGAPQYLDSCGSAADPRTARGPVRALPRAAGWILAAGAGLMSACEDTKPPAKPAAHGGTEVVAGTVMGAVAPAPPERMGKVAPVEMLGEVAFPVEHPEESGSPDGIPTDGGEGSGCRPAPEPEDVSAHAEMLGRVAPLDAPPPEGH